jgi:GntR family transcriptional regulator
MQQKFPLVVDKAADTPVYRQIVEQVTQLIKHGDLLPGDRLPPERDLAHQLGTARGTITRAYERLAGDNVVIITQGRGTFVSDEQNVFSEGRKETAIGLINRLIVDLERIKFTHREIGTLFQLLLHEREEVLSSFDIATIDSNPESMAVFEEQLRHLSNVRIVKFMLSDVLSGKTSSRKLLKCDLVLTNSAHYKEILSTAPKLKPRLVQAAVSPSQQTIIDLAGIPAMAMAAIVCRSEQFLSIITDKLQDFRIPASHVKHAFESDDIDLDSLLADCQVLIIPPDSPLETEREHVGPLRRFRDRGGSIIHFRYQIERGTLIHIEEKISKLLENS